jgi:Pyruvate phosphate dikinase, AMP/ATP-binding domain/Cyclic nucleotide-binding domain
MNEIVPLVEAREDRVFGSKAVDLGQATRAGLPVPPGVALAGSVVEAVASGDVEAIRELTAATADLPRPLAARSSCVDEDGAAASFAGQHLTVLNVLTPDDLAAALREIWWSANSDSAITYRQRVGLMTRPSVGVVVQSLLDPDAAGVMFTQNPINGANECLIEASWGLGESVVAGRVIPDTYRISHAGEILERTAGVKKIAVRRKDSGGTVEEDVEPGRVEALCLSDAQLVGLHGLARKCEEAYGPGRDIEWAFVGGQLYLLQCRAITRAGTKPATPAAAPVPGPDETPDAAPIDVLERVDLFCDLNSVEVTEISRLFKERTFAAGETVAKEGAGGASFFIIKSGEATVTTQGRTRAALGPGDHFGEIALIDEGARSATITATTELVCYGLTLWDFQPLVQSNGAVSWKLLQSLAKRLRGAQAE